MNRLDSVCGPEAWWDEYVPLENSVICKLTLRLPDGSTVTKCDAGGYAGMADQGDDDKSGFSDSFKRACAKWGVGRYLYRDGVPRFEPVAAPAEAREPGSDEGEAHGEPEPAQAEEVAATSPRLHDPEPAASPSGRAPTRPSEARPEKAAVRRCPDDGRAFFRWLKDREVECESMLVKHVNDWGKRFGLPARVVDWDAEQVKSAFPIALEKYDRDLPKAGTPEVAEDGPPPDAAPAGKANPLQFEADDPLKGVKAGVLNAVVQLCYATLGHKPKTKHACERIAWIADEVKGQPATPGVDNLREERRGWLLNKILEHANREVADLRAMQSDDRAMESERKGGAA